MRRWGLVVAMLGACGSVPEPVGDTDSDADGDSDGLAQATTYHRDVRPIFEKNCVGCHSEGQIGPFPMAYDAQAWDAAPPTWFASSAAAVASGTMPPWMPADDCQPIQDARGLSDAAKQTVADWAADGFLLGDPADFVARPGASEVDLGTPDWEIAGAEPYTPDTTRPDDYRCLVLDHDVDVDRWLKAFAVQPDQIDMVHHVILYRLDAAWADDVAAWDEADEGVGYTCFGSPGTWEADTIAGWAPGQQPEVYGEDEARKIPAGSVLVLQMHFNTLNLGDTPPEADQTSVQMWLMPEGEQPRLELMSVPFPKTDIFLPAGDPQIDEVSEVSPSVLLGPVQVRGIYPHMHQLGTRIRVDVVSPEGEEACLVNVPQWDFNWQQSYLYKDGGSVSVRRDDKIRLSCSYDNSAANQPVVNGEQLEPRDVRWGDESLDEMCLAYLYVTRPLLAE